MSLDNVLIYIGDTGVSVNVSGEHAGRIVVLSGAQADTTIEAWTEHGAIIARRTLADLREWLRERPDLHQIPSAPKEDAHKED